MANKFEMNTFDGESICFEFNSIIVCNRNIKQQILNGCVKIECLKPFIIMTNDKFTDEEVEVLEDASIADCLSLYKHQPAFGGVLI